jgi:PAS domain S-box-containing protein
LPVSVLLINKEGKIVYKNKQAAKMEEQKVLDALATNKKICVINNITYKINLKKTAREKIVTLEAITQKEKVGKKDEIITEKFKSLCNNAPIGIALIDNKNVSFVNTVFEDFLGYDSLELKNKLFELVHPKDCKKIDKLLSGKPQQLQLLNKSKQNRWFNMGCHAINLNGSSQLIHAIDVTQNKKMEIKLQDAQKKMQLVLERERQFLEEISHYFFNPLCIAKGYLDLSIPQAEPPLKQKLEITKEAISRVENVVKHIVTEGRIYE